MLRVPSQWQHDKLHVRGWDILEWLPRRWVAISIIQEARVWKKIEESEMIEDAYQGCQRVIKQADYLGHMINKY
jgi:hypothetical protein